MVTVQDFDTGDFLARFDNLSELKTYLSLSYPQSVYKYEVSDNRVYMDVVSFDGNDGVLVTFDPPLPEGVEW